MSFRAPILLALLTMLALATGAQAKAIFVTTLADSPTGGPPGTCTLRDAVRAANADDSRGGCTEGGGEDDIVLPAGRIILSVPGVGELQAVTGDLNVQNGALTVHGNPAGTVIDGNGLDRVFLAQQPLTLRDLTIANGLARRNDPSTTSGGAIVAFQGLVLDHVIVEGNRTDAATGSGFGIGNTAGFGGAVYAIGTKAVTITDSTFRDNRTGAGAPAPAGFGTHGGGGGPGGAIYADAPSIVIERTTFAGNRTGPGGNGAGAGQEAGAGGYYAAAALSGASLSLRDVVVTGNVVGASGAGPNSTEGRGALGAFGTTTTLRHLTVAGNVALEAGTAEGVVTEPPRVVTVTSSILTGAGALCMGPFVDGGRNVTSPGSGCPGSVGDPGLDEDLIPAAGGPAVDLGAGACDGTDIRGVARPQGASCDAGAIERRPSTVTLAPASLAFPSIVPGASSAPRTVALTYAGDGSVRLGALATTGDFTASGCSGMTLRTAGGCTIAVVFRPAGAGARGGTLSLATPLGPRDVALAGTGAGAGLRAGGATGSSTARVRVLGTALLRRHGAVRLRVRLACPAGAGCAERLRLRVSRIGVRKLFATRRIVLAGGGRRTVVITLPPRFADLDPGTRLGVRLRLVAPGRARIERTVRRSLP